MRTFLACLLLAVAVPPGLTQGTPTIQVTPANSQLRGKAARQQLLVTRAEAGRNVDRTRDAKFRSATPSIVQVDSAGVVTPVGDGAGIVVATLDGQDVRATFKVVDGGRYLPATFEKDIQPILARTGCNTGPCHGKARGQNNFQLSLLGFDADFDFNALTQEARGRRLFPAAPEHSLLLLKGAGMVPHGGGRRLIEGSPHYEVLRRWIADGTPRTPKNEPTLERITVEPGERILAAGAEQQLVVTAHFANKTTQDVTHLAMFQSNESVIAAVDGHGRVKAGPLPGEAAIMARYLEKFAVCNILIPLPKSAPAEAYAKLPRGHFIDGHVWDKLQRLGVTPSEPCSDLTFHRRAYLDVIGKLPTPDETKAFLANPASDKRAKLIDALLDRPEYADHWANKWADLLRPNPYRVGIKAVFSLDAFLRDSFRRNKPYDQFAREIITAQGSTFRNGAAVVFRDRREPDELTTIMSQLFLGVRLE
jgi:hypothetical protein